MPVRLGDQQCFTIRRDRHPIREREPVGNFPQRSVRSNTRQRPAVHIGISACIHDDLVPEPRRNRVQITQLLHKRSIHLAPQKQSLRPGNNQHPSIREPVEAEGKRRRNLHHRLTPSIGVDGDNLLRASQFASQSRPSCQRGDSPIASPWSATRGVGIASGRHIA